MIPDDSRVRVNSTERFVETLRTVPVRGAVGAPRHPGERRRFRVPMTDRLL